MRKASTELSFPFADAAPNSSIKRLGAFPGPQHQEATQPAFQLRPPEAQSVLSLQRPCPSQEKSRQESTFPFLSVPENRYLENIGQGAFPAQMAKVPAQELVPLPGDLMFPNPAIRGLVRVS